MSDFPPLQDLEELAEELIASGEGTPDDAGITCVHCGEDIMVPWALRDQLEGRFAEHLVTHGLTLDDIDWGEEEDEEEDDD